MRKAMTVLVVGMFVLGVISVSPALADQRDTKATKEASVSFRLASTTPTPGYEKVSLAGEGTLYVAPTALWTGDDVQAVATQDSGATSSLSLTLKTQATERSSALARHNAGQRLAVYVDGRLVGSATLGSDSVSSRATINGLSTATAGRLSRLLGGDARVSGPMLSAVASRNTVAAGGTVAVDVFVSNVAALRTYEVSLAATGGNSGRLTFENLKVHTERPDFVFAGTSEMITAEDQIRARLGGVLFKGGRDVESNGYLGTFTVRASADASGTFQVNLQRGEKSFMGDPVNQKIDFHSGPAATITVMSSPRTGQDQ